ncbi:aconitate hydratase AcnA [Virgibacillus halodenitrificans]|uniref:Aconitate hydratase n=1 Tax=Virgibacillus halodenitrificans TaxID=1482 RepID=A0ABR7VQX6_VIRHA|nr:aconitate hydratase AcnA [Virgibacillus halodenitrificans]MBD1224280.1 aconitate hydratase AcnA [Virgibacillus halodenitrificans]MCG1028405.1 aconitate hydratase AcnA [Virgibacillus halodenitrificans]MCJ0931106.1 aconitate hydratase AcnA [Virgibacillus halodenitrificans]MEC2160495.1 aconitate hydratase AcnA [Virgibacillus halodenitrificans]MYL45361.1 aconitate hydratase AcnA [Virgibacillus halodenitrificans]
MGANNTFHAKKQFELNGKTYNYYHLKALEEAGLGKVSRLPFSIRVLLESLVRQHDGHQIKDEHVQRLSKWGTDEGKGVDVPFKPSRVILQDFTGVPAVVDLASLRKAMVDMGGEPDKINPEVPVDLVIDHSVQVDQYGTPNALKANMDLEFERNAERYEFLNWAQKAFENYRAVPPATGIVHQVNLEYIANVVHGLENENGEYDAFPDTLVGTDSHTTMINGLGVLGWGVGGIEAEAGMLGQPSYFPAPEVIGVKFTGSFPNGTTATDLALKVTQVLREKNVVGKFVEYFGPGLKDMPLADRATISNMAPEYGATCGFFPVDEESLNYLRLTGRDKEQIDLVEQYCKANDLWYSADQEDPEYTELVEINLSELEPNLSGPKRPQDLIALSDMKKEFNKAITAPEGNQGFGMDKSEFDKEVTVEHPNGSTSVMKTGALAIAAITSCTNTSNPYVMLGAGLLAKKAVEKGLQVPDYVKTSLAPGSKVVTRYLEDSGLMPFLDQLGFNLVGYGCTTCIGNSGPLREEIEQAIMKSDLTVSSVLSGNRNFEGRIHPLVKANYLASPPLVVAYALAGTVDVDLSKEPLGKDKDGNAVYMNDIWPTMEEIKDQVEKVVTPEIFRKEYENVFQSNEKWNEINTTDEPLFEWDADSTYIQNPPFFEGLGKNAGTVQPLTNLRAIGKFGDSVTTDHISPAGAIAKDMPAGKYLQDKGVSPRNFNSYGSRRGNHEVMMRGTFANIRIRNLLAPGTEGGYTTYWPTEDVMPIYDAAMKYQQDGTGLIVIGGKDYGMGSSRDWAAKGTNLLGIKTVIAESFERIHRSNLVMMGVLPLQFAKGDSADKLGLTGKESFTVEVNEDVKPHDLVKVTAVSEDGKTTTFDAVARFDSDVEIDYYRHGGILQMVLRNKLEV